jgi:4-carboxymuconolactone decarboxylase
MDMKSERYRVGWENYSELFGEQGKKVIDALNEISPDFARLTIEFPFGDVISRPEVDLKTREMATVAALTAMGTAAPQLKVHVNGALNVGCSPREIVEIIFQMALYAGFPAALNGLFAAKEVFDERNLTVGG